MVSLTADAQQMLWEEKMEEVSRRKREKYADGGGGGGGGQDVCPLGKGLCRKSLCGDAVFLPSQRRKINVECSCFSF